MSFIIITLKQNMKIVLSCFLQTEDSLVYEIETVDIYKDFYKDKDLFDFSGYRQDSKVFDPVKKKRYWQNER